MVGVDVPWNGNRLDCTGEKFAYQYQVPPQNVYGRDRKINANFSNTKVFENPSGHGRPHQNRGRPHRKVCFPVAPVVGRNSLTPAQFGRKGVCRKFGPKVYVYVVVSSLIWGKMRGMNDFAFLQDNYMDQGGRKLFKTCPPANTGTKISFPRSAELFPHHKTGRSTKSNSRKSAHAEASFKPHVVASHLRLPEVNSRSVL